MTLRIPSLFKITPTHLSVLLGYVLTQDLTQDLTVCTLSSVRLYLVTVEGKDLELSQEQINGR